MSPILLIFIFLFLLSQGNSLKEMVYAVLIIFGILLMLILINKIFPYKEKTYFLADGGMTISNGKKIQKYLWSDFECFYPYSEGRGFKPNPKPRDTNLEKNREKFFESGRKAEGEMFYIKKKSGNKFFKIFVVIRSKIDNQKMVNKFLSNYLTRRPMRGSTDLGLVFYEFK